MKRTSKERKTKSKSVKPKSRKRPKPLPRKTELQRLDARLKIVENYHRTIANNFELANVRLQLSDMHRMLSIAVANKLEQYDSELADDLGVIRTPEAGVLNPMGQIMPNELKSEKTVAEIINNAFRKVFK